MLQDFTVFFPNDKSGVRRGGAQYEDLPPAHFEAALLLYELVDKSGLACRLDVVGRESY